MNVRTVHLSPAATVDEDDRSQDPDFNFLEDNNVLLSDLKEELRADKAVRVSSVSSRRSS